MVSQRIYFFLFLLLNSSLIAQNEQKDTLFLEHGTVTYNAALYTRFFLADEKEDFKKWVLNHEQKQGATLENFKAIITPQDLSYWGKLIVKNNTPFSLGQDSWIFCFSSYATFIDFYIYYPESGTYQYQQTGGWIPLKEHSLKWNDNYYYTSLNIPSGVTKTIYYRFTSIRTSVLPTFLNELVLENDLVFKQSQDFFYNGFFLGIIFIFFIYSSLMYFIIQEKTYLFYSLFLFGLLIYSTFIFNGFTSWWMTYVFIEKPIYIYFLRYAFYIILIGYIAFCVEFLRTKEKYPKWYRYFKILQLLLFFFFLADISYVYQFGLNFFYPDIILAIYILLAAISVICLVFYAYFQKDKNSYFLLGSILCLVLTGFFYAGNLFTTWSYGDLMFRLGFITEISLFAIGLAYQRKQNLSEKELVNINLQEQKWQKDQQILETKRVKELATFKNQLFTNITHEFRTPLTVIIGMANQITEKPRQWQQQGLEMILRSGQNLLNLVNQMLDLAKIEAGQMQPKYIQGNVINYLQYLIEAFHSFAATKRINLVFNKVTDSLVMDYDEDKLKTIITNLLSNAVKFTPEKGEIVVHTKLLLIEETDKKGKTNLISYCQIKIRDNGIGIAPDKLPHVFDRFYQVEDAVNYSGGTGVGLSLTKELVELMEGNITVNSRLNDGSEFIILLPFRQTAPLIKDTSIIRRTIFPSVGKGLPVETYIDETLPLVLVIEDNLDVITYLQACLMDRYRILIALDGQVGIDKALEHTPDLIISDVMMPEKNGFEVCAFLKAEERTSHIPIIMLTARAHIEDKITGLSKGADAYLSKPFHQKELEIRLEQLLLQRKRLQHYFAQQTLALPKVTDVEIISPPIENAFLKKVEQVIEDNLMADLGLDQICQLLLMSRSQVYRKIKALTGHSTTIFIRHIRLKLAHQLLITTDKTVSEVAYEVGFKDPSFFSRSFSEVYGTSPSEIKAK